MCVHYSARRRPLLNPADEGMKLHKLLKEVMRVTVHYT